MKKLLYSVVFCSLTEIYGLDQVSDSGGYIHRLDRSKLQLFSGKPEPMPKPDNRDNPRLKLDQSKFQAFSGTTSPRAPRLPRLPRPLHYRAMKTADGSVNAPDGSLAPMPAFYTRRRQPRHPNALPGAENAPTAVQIPGSQSPAAHHGPIYYPRRRLPVRRPNELSGAENASTAAQIPGSQSPAIDPFSTIQKNEIKPGENFYEETKKVFAKVDTACNFGRKVKFLAINANERDVVAKANGRPVIVIDAADGKIAFSCFFNSITIIFPNGQKNVCLANYFSDKNLLESLGSENLGNSPDWTLGGRLDNSFVIDNWHQKWANGEVILLLNYNGKLYTAEPF